MRTRQDKHTNGKDSRNAAIEHSRTNRCQGCYHSVVSTVTSLMHERVRNVRGKVDTQTHGNYDVCGCHYVYSQSPEMHEAHNINLKNTSVMYVPFL